MWFLFQQYFLKVISSCIVDAYVRHNRIVYLKGICSPSRNVLGILAGAATVGVTDLEDGPDRAAVFSGDTLETYVVLSAILRMGVSAEAAGCAAHFARGRTRETVGDLCV